MPLHTTTRVLDAWGAEVNGAHNGHNVHLWAFGGLTQQKWVFEAAGRYRSVTGFPPNCMGYALFKTAEVKVDKILGATTTEAYRQNVINCIQNQGYSCRSLNSHTDTIQINEYRVAYRQHQNNTGGHIVMQLSDGSWAGKNHDDISRHFTGNINPSTHKQMWYHIYDNLGRPKESTYTTNVIYFAVKR